MAEQNKRNARPPRGARGMSSVKDPGKVFKRTMGYMLKGNGFSFAMVVLCIIVSAFTTVVGIMVMRDLVDDYIVPLTHQVHPDYGPLAGMIGKMALVFALGVVCNFVYQRLMVNISEGTMKRLREEVFTHMENLPLQYFDQNSHGDIMSVYTNDIDTLRQLYSQSIPQIINSGLSVIMTLVSMFILDVPLTLIAIFMVLVLLVVLSNMGKISGKYFLKQQKDLGATDGYIEEMMTGQKVVKVFNHEDENNAGFTELNESLQHSASRANGIANIMMPISGNVGNLSYVICAIVGGAIALSGRFSITIGTIISFLTMNKSFNQPVTQVAMQMNSIIMAMAGAERIFTLLDTTVEKDEGYVELVNVKEGADGSLEECEERTERWAWKHPHKEDGTVTFTELKGGVTFDDVNFGYTDDKMVLHDITLYAEPGQKIAFVGSTGAGKTTITNLINRFNDIQDGKIRYDGINVDKIRKPDLRRSLGMVLQNTHLFTGTVMENIRYGRLDATDEECIAAAQLANADGFIRRLPDGYDTLLKNDGSNLSQGQRQLLAIARAAVADPPVLILDEATSSIDTRTEQLVHQGMDALMYNRTTFVIAHRLSTVRNADCIMVLEHGRIIERGTHDDLIAAKGRYYQLYTGHKAEPVAENPAG